MQENTGKTSHGDIISDIFFRSLKNQLFKILFMNSVLDTFRRWNKNTVWLLFAISATVYIMTVEPTVSFWDCGEFILSAFRLQVGHPPGAPVFVMLGRIATLFAGGDASKAAIMVNILSALCSAFAIMFLYWTITHLLRRVVTGKGVFDSKYILPVTGSGIIGALAYTFSDTFWFSAVEGELYALSSLCTAAVFWAMLKWEEEADEHSSGRWIILIAYIMGLGLGIHRLNLLVIPVLVFVFYFKKYRITRNGILLALLVAVSILGAMVFILIPGIPKAAGWFELFFVNILGLPYNTGLFIFIVSVIVFLVFSIRYSIREGKIILNYIITILTVILIGHSSYAMIMIRSSAKPPMNQNNPSDIFALAYYINMQQYGSSPKFFGPYYSAPAVDVKRIISGYNKVNGKYEPYYRPEYKYDSRFETIFPRMYSPDPDHESAYKFWGRIKGRRYSVSHGSDKETLVCPTFGENLRFFFRYQAGFMYLRYFMWNFAGRQNDVQGNGNKIHGNWISGIKFIDNARLGNQESLPGELRDNPGRNRYFMLPLLIGLAGIIWQFRKDKRGLFLVFSFFIMTGLAIIFYLNQYPNQPRERDYAYAGSFYAFAIWIGMGFMLVYELIQKFVGHMQSAIMTFMILLATGPLIMARENWDDHDRSGRYTARDIGANYLESCAPNSILFTYGDNDSFPLWYIQDVEEVRTDVRVANLSYLQAGWYIEMMRQKAFESDPIPLSLEQDKYREGIRTQLPVLSRIDKPVNIMEIVNFAGLDDPKYHMDLSGRGDYVNYIPTNKLLIDVDTSFVLANGTVKEHFRDRLISPMLWEFTATDAFKDDLAIMDLIATSKWTRPIYFSTTVPSSQYNGLEKFFVQEGMAYRIVPIKTGEGNYEGDFGIIDPEVMYDNMMNKFRWGNSDDPSVYLDENNRRMFSNFRRLFGNLGKALLESGDTLKAVEVTRRGIEIVPSEKLPHDFFSIGLAEVLFRTGNKEEGNKLAGHIINYSREYLDYSISLDPDQRYGLDYPTGINMQALLDLYRMAINLNDTDLTAITETLIGSYYDKLYPRK